MANPTISSYYCHKVTLSQYEPKWHFLSGTYHNSSLTAHKMKIKNSNSINHQEDECIVELYISSL